MLVGELLRDLGYQGRVAAVVRFIEESDDLRDHGFSAFNLYAQAGAGFAAHAIEQLEAHFPYKVGLHNCCHGHRGLLLAKSSEKMEAPFSKIRYLLDKVKDIELVQQKSRTRHAGAGGPVSGSR